MAHEDVRIQLRCSNCDRVIATIPAGEQVETELVCPRCGATVTPPGPIARVATKIKKTVEEMRNPDKEEPNE